MATWNTLTRPVYGGPAQQPDFFNRSKTNSVRQLSLAKVPGADPMIKSSFDTAARLQASMGRDVGAYRGVFNATLPQASGYLDQDLGDLSRYFSPGGYEADLAGAFIDLNLGVGTGTSIPDRSTNAYNGLLVGSAEHLQK